MESGAFMYLQLEYVEMETYSATSDQPMANLNGSESMTPSIATSKRFYTSLVFFALAVVATWQGIWLVPSDKLCMQTWSSPSPAQKAVDYSWQLFQNNFGDDLPLFRTPDAELEAEWRLLEQANPFPVSNQEIEWLELNVKGNWMRESEGDGDRAIAFLEVTHQISCLNLLRQHTRRHEYDYSQFDSFRGSEREVMQRVDGCLQYLRHVIECVGDTTPYLVLSTPTKALKERPDFNTLHYCRDPAHIQRWKKAHSVEAGVQNVLYEIM
ncbi:hypothetical protein G7Y89_g12176 [Cudoniella acicularis]|uniref:Cyclochlorotine biosynthesis protein O n=1 Tax=Cudoniella acicularis TaxID=354080 RepID=A0A8H4RBQ6_9HELO|nr:hypothetical protein G7Y89_g12176 [Cudoniella acicularis]